MAENGFNFDERIKRLIEAMAEGFQTVTADIRDLVSGIRTLMRTVEQDHKNIEILLHAARASQHTEDSLKEATWDLKESIRGLKEIAESHERRLHRLEGGEERSQ